MSKENMENENLKEEKCHCKENEFESKHCHCHENGSEGRCHSDDKCKCQGNEKSHNEDNCKSHNDEKCDCHCDNKDCHCDEECECGCSEEKSDAGLEYLNLARQIQADFENFRRHALEDIKQAKISGQASIIEAFLPCLDTFKEAKKSISDNDVLKGVEMIENKIVETLKNVGVEKIESVGEKYNPHIHNVIAVLNVGDKENDVIIDEYQAGYMFNGKVIRYAKVIVNKKEN